MHTKPAYDTGLDEGVRHGWIEALEYVLTILNDEMNHQGEKGEVEAEKALYRLATIFSHRRKEWMLDG